MAVNAKEVFSTAEVFRDAARILDRSMSEGLMLHLALPLVVNAAFSTELYLKCLLLVENNPTEGHL